jgi:4-oxalocrotonate tautomerase
MPYVRVEMIEGRSEEKRAKIARRITQALVECACSTAEGVFVVFEDVNSESWAIGGELMSERKRKPESAKQESTKREPTK